MNRLPKTLLLAAAIALVLGTNPALAIDKMSAKDQSGSVVNARQEAQIWTTYALSPYLRTNDLTVIVEDGNVTLKGNVEEDVHKDLAAAIAAGVDGIKDVDNQIKVDADYKKPYDSSKRGYGDMVDDATITAAVKSKLLWSKHTEGMDTKVVTHNGKVTLNGNVATQQAKQQAEQIQLKLISAQQTQDELEEQLQERQDEHSLQQQHQQRRLPQWQRQQRRLATAGAWAEKTATRPAMARAATATGREERE